MPDLNFEIVESEPLPYAVDPQIMFKLKIDNPKPEQEIHSVVLQCQIQIESMRRRYTPEEQTRLRDLFDEPERWSKTLRTMLWTHTNTVVPRFTEALSLKCLCIARMISILPRPNILPRSMTVKSHLFSSLAERSFMRELAECCRSGRFRGQRNRNFVCPLKFGKK